MFVKMKYQLFLYIILLYNNNNVLRPEDQGVTLRDD